MRDLRKRVKATLWVLVVCAAAATAAAYFNRVDSPLLRAADKLGISVVATNRLGVGVTFNKRVADGQMVNVGFCDATEERIAGLHPGGDDFVRPCTSGDIDLCVNAKDSAGAISALEPELKQRGLKVGLAAFFGHGLPGQQMIGRHPVTLDLLKFLSEHRATDRVPEINFMGCTVADGEKGRRYLQEVATEYRFNAFASCDYVDWDVVLRFGKTNFSVNPDATYVAVPDGEGAKKHIPSASATTAGK